MALIEAVFRRKSSERTLTFQEIAEETHTQLAEVEHLVMKALRCAFISSTVRSRVTRLERGLTRQSFCLQFKAHSGRY